MIRQVFLVLIFDPPFGGSFIKIVKKPWKTADISDQILFNVLLICRTNVVVSLSEQNSKKTYENICFLWRHHDRMTGTQTRFKCTCTYFSMLCSLKSPLNSRSMRPCYPQVFRVWYWRYKIEAHYSLCIKRTIDRNILSMDFVHPAMRSRYKHILYVIFLKLTQILLT